MDEQSYPQRMHTALDAIDPRGLAEFYRQLLGLRYRPGDERPDDGPDEGADWLVLVDEHGERQLAIQENPRLVRSTWPDPDVPMQAHIDYRVANPADLRRHREHAEALGATVLLDRTDDEDELLFVLADPEGHPFCLLTARG